jgi:hypothetical protein
MAADWRAIDLTEFLVQRGNVTEIPSDLLLLKHAQAFYGADRAVSSCLVSAHVCRAEDLRPPPGEFRIVETNGSIAPSRVMFVGTPPLHDFTYDRMESFARTSVEILAEFALPVRVITTTVHGTGYGLDSGESLQRLVHGFREGLAAWKASTIERIVFVTLDERQERILASVLSSLSPKDAIRGEISGVVQKTVQEMEVVASTKEPASETEPAASGSTQATGQSTKKRVFVAMPYSEEFENVYEFGIYPAVRNCGFICERVDEVHFTGDVLRKIREGIETADLMIADLSEARPNVYLEVGYAWGRGIDVIFLARKGEDLHFDVRTHRCIYYGRFAELAKRLETLLKGLDESKGEAP